jgi:hypothetical protein
LSIYSITGKLLKEDLYDLILLLRGKDVYGNENSVEKQTLGPLNPGTMESSFPTKLEKNLNILDT